MSRQPPLVRHRLFFLLLRAARLQVRASPRLVPLWLLLRSAVWLALGLLDSMRLLPMTPRPLLPLCFWLLQLLGLRLVIITLVMVCLVQIIMMLPVLLLLDPL